MIRFDYNLPRRKQVYFEFKVTIAHFQSDETLTISVYAPFTSTEGIAEIIKSVAPTWVYLQNIQFVGKCPDSYEHSSNYNHYTINQLVNIVSTIKFTKKVKKMVEVEVEEEIL